MLTIGTDTYISLADARTYISENSLPSLPTDDTEAEGFLRRAAKAVDRRWGNRFIGTKRTVEQKLAWPRDVNLSPIYYRGSGEGLFTSVDSDGNPRDFQGIPSELGEAQVEMAVLLLDGVDPLKQNEAPVTQSTDTVDVITTSRTYAAPYSQPAFYNVMVILRPLLKSSATITSTRGA